jgi:uncharacterized integral membrane protein (TIGR00698 family)
MSRLLLLPLIALLAINLASLEAVARMGLSALPLAIIFGILAGHFLDKPLDDREQRFSRFCQQRCLRVGIILFGLSLSFQQIVAVGWQAILLNSIVIVAIVGCGLWIGIRLLKLPRDMVILISAGSAICGAAAILATDSTLKAKQQQVTVAVATVVIFGTLAMFCYPLIFAHVQMSEQAFGIYIGSTVHEVAQAVAAGASISPEALNNAVVTKLIRVMLLAPFVLILGGVLSRLATAGGESNNRQPLMIPWFVLGFIAMTAINSFWDMPEWLLNPAAQTSQFLLAIAMAALGTQTRWCLLRQAGSRPIALAFLLFLLLIFGGLLLNQWLI